jgi:seryl-tRNA synthetase
MARALVKPIERIRQDPEKVRDMLAARGFDAQLDRILEVDREVRALKARKEQLQAERNKASRGGPPSDEVKERMRAVGDEIRAIDTRLTEHEAALEEKLLWIPNEIDPRVPRGKDENDNVVVRKDPPKPLGFEPKPHWEVGERLGILDIPRGTKLSGSRFYVLRGAGAALQRALIAWMIDHKIAAGFSEVYPPFVTKRETLIATGQLPHFDENLYRDEDDDIWLVPTAEPQLVAYHRDEILDVKTMPRKYVAYTACFRREHMSAGRDVRGIKRGHEFDKVEMVVHCMPDDSPNWLDRMTQLAVEVVDKLELPVRVTERCTGDLGFNTLRGFDIDAWGPASNEWLEVSSASNCGSFQAERSNIRFRREAGGKTEYVHTLNASGVALPRLMIAIMENYQRDDGSLEIPRVIREYMSGRDRIRVGEFAL